LGQAPVGWVGREKIHSWALHMAFYFSHIAEVYQLLWHFVLLIGMLPALT
jgi:hypothetical protein